VGVKKKSKKVTQGDIAKTLKLSITTVSRALQNDPTINPETRAQVMETAARLNYLPRQSRSSRVGEKEESKKQHQFVCVLIKLPIEMDAWAPDEVASGYLAGMSEVAASFNVSMVIHHFNDETVTQLEDPLQSLPITQDDRLAGFILIHHFPHSVVHGLCERWPVVSLVHDVPDSRIDLIDMDNNRAIRQLVEQLIALGHKRIGFMGHRPHLAWSQARLSGYMGALFSAGLTIDPQLILGEADPRSVLELHKNGVTAWVCSVDVVAYRLCRDLLDDGLKIPEQLSITGFNAVQPLLDCPQVTTVQAPFKQMGAAALQRLMLRIDSPSAQPIKILHRCAQVPGHTIGPCL
jgi:DNA-binding LacI/PurR family transcriptional regulator